MMDTSELLTRMKAHIAQMAPHQRTRQQGALFVEAYCQLLGVHNAMAALKRYNEVTCPKCFNYYPGHATGSGDICDCKPS